MKQVILFTCEHGGNDIPLTFLNLFRKYKKMLQTHRGFDPGALELAKELSREFSSHLIYSTTSRLLVDLNRSEHNRAIFSEATNELSKHEKERILTLHYKPYRKQVESYVKSAIAHKKKVLHISVHSFTNILNSTIRKCDIGLLYDPKRFIEKELCSQWHKILSKTPYQTKKNYPYKGTSDGLTTYLRSIYPEDAYAGIELEVNQKFPLRFPKQWEELKQTIEQSLKQLLDW